MYSDGALLKMLLTRNVTNGSEDGRTIIEIVSVAPSKDYDSR
jgi:hypothetical protein